MDRVAELLERIDVLEEEKRQLEELLYPADKDVATIRSVWRFPNQEAELLAMLYRANGRVVSFEHLAHVLARREDVDSPIHMLRVLASKLRRRLKSAAPGVEIKVSYGTGYRLEGRAALQEAAGGAL